MESNSRKYDLKKSLKENLMELQLGESFYIPTESIMSKRITKDLKGSYVVSINLSNPECYGFCIFNDIEEAVAYIKVNWVEEMIHHFIVSLFGCEHTGKYRIIPTELVDIAKGEDDEATMFRFMLSKQLMDKMKGL